MRKTRASGMLGKDMLPRRTRYQTGLITKRWGARPAHAVERLIGACAEDSNSTDKEKRP